MGLFSLFSFTQEIAIDLGTANVLIMHNNNVVVDQPSIVAIDQNTGKMIALGSQARLMEGRAPDNIKTIRPLRNGVIANFDAAEQMLRGMIKLVNPSKWYTPSLKMVVCIPSGSTEVEIRAVRDSSEHAGGRDVYMIYEPMAAAIGIGVDVTAPEGAMIIDIGGGTSEIAVIALGGIVYKRSITDAGDVFTADVQDYMRQEHNIRLGDRTAEEIKIQVGAVLENLEDPPQPYEVNGPNLMSGLPIKVPVSYQEIAHCLDKSIGRLESAILDVLEHTPPELYADIVKHGIFLTGGGALLRGLDKRLTNRFGIAFTVSDDPLHAVARGTGIALNNIEKFSFLMR